MSASARTAADGQSQCKQTSANSTLCPTGGRQFLIPFAPFSFQPEKASNTCVWDNSHRE